MGKKIFLLLILIPTIAIASNYTECGSPIPILQKPIIFNAERKALTYAYKLEHYGIKKKELTIIPKIIVLHATDASFNQTFFKFNNPKLFDRPELNKAGLLNVSTHFLVDKNGVIYQLMPDNWMARHVIGFNNNAIGIENVGRENGADLTQAQINSDAYLVCMLKYKYPSINYLIGHYSYLRFRNSSLWSEKKKHYITYKVDPGAIFVAAVREKVKNLNLKSTIE